MTWKPAARSRKKNSPSIVGILADLSGDRANPDDFPVLKERRMVDIDRDNFNDVMKTIGPRADLLPVLNQVPDRRTARMRPTRRSCSARSTTSSPCAW